jgi:hypothetical protein
LPDRAYSNPFASEGNSFIASIVERGELITLEIICWNVTQAVFIRDIYLFFI